MPTYKFTVDSDILPETPSSPLSHLVAGHRYAVCTLVMKDCQYGEGAAVLAHSIRNTYKAKVDLVCLVTNDLVAQMNLPEGVRNSPNLHILANEKIYPKLSRDAQSRGISCLKILLNIFDHVVLIDPINRPVLTYRLRPEYHGWVSCCFSKLYIFRLTSYEKVLFLDADMLCTGDFSAIFQFTCPFGTLVESMPGYSSGELITKERLATSLHNRFGISAACFCVQPSDAEFWRAMRRLDSRTEEGDTWVRTRNGGKKRAYNETLESIWPDCPQGGHLYAGPDEKLLGWMYFPRDGNPSWRNLSQQYNCLAWQKHKFERGDFSGDVDDSQEKRPLGTGKKVAVYIVHYSTQKPWDKPGKDGEIWPDIEMWFKSLDSLRTLLGFHVGGTAGLSQPDIDAILRPLCDSDRFMSQENADQCLAKTKWRKIKRIGAPQHGSVAQASQSAFEEKHTPQSSRDSSLSEVLT